MKESIDKYIFEVNKERVGDIMVKAVESRRNNIGIFESEIQLPEHKFVENLNIIAEETNDEILPLNAMFFTTSVIFAGNTADQFAYISDLEKMKESVWLFQPKKILEEDNNLLLESLNKFYLPSGYNKAAYKEWKHNAGILENKYNGDLKNYFTENNNDALLILKDLVGPIKKAKHEGFHRFGDKLARLFMQWVGQYNLADLKNLDNFGVPVDFQITRIIVQTGGIVLQKPTPRGLIMERTLTPLITELCREKQLQPREVSEALWLIGNKCCNLDRFDLCPLCMDCTSKISRRSVDVGGLIDPKDTKRCNLT